MKKMPHFLPLIFVFLSLYISACKGSAPATLPTQLAPTQTLSVPTQTRLVPTVVSTQQIFSPACAPCLAPVFVDTEANQTYCVKKIPYQNFSVEPGTQFEPLDPAGGLKCADSGTVSVIAGHGLKVWSCTGKQLWTYELKIISPSCRSRMLLKLDVNHCQPGLLYSAAQNCCTTFTDGGPAPVIIKVNMGACK